MAGRPQLRAGPLAAGRRHVTLGETTWEVFHTPGHTPGHVVFFHRPSRFAQVGDVLFKGSVGRPTSRAATTSS
jgi:glyoxylase-like metal-dependent hydrolase (beta-lactamase superfamily II)